MNYWEERFIELEELRHKISKEDYSLLVEEFEKLEASINFQIEKWIYRIAENNDISLSEARRLLSAEELEEFKWSVDTFIKKGIENSINKRWIKQLENASARVHISKLEALNFYIRAYAEETFSMNQKTITTTITKTFKEIHAKSLFELQKGTGLSVAKENLNTGLLDRIIERPWANDGLNFSERLWKQKESLIDSVNKEITRNIAVGNEPTKSVKVIKQFVNKEVKNKKYASARLLQTETAFFSEQAIFENFKNLNIDRYIIVATLDTRTSDICRDMDGKVFEISEHKQGVTAPLFHTNCRSTIAPYFDDEFTADDLRIAKDKDDNTIYVPASMTYKEYFEKYIKGQ